MVKKRKSRKKQSPESTPIPSLPDDLVMCCLARVSRLYYLNLSLVSKSFRSLLTSPELYKTRILLGCTESCLYVCLRCPEEANPRWFTLYQKPNQTTEKKKKKESSCNILAPVPILNSPPEELSGFIAVDRESICMIESITYFYVPPGKFLWKTFHTKGAVLRRLEGLEGLPKFARYSNVRLVNYGGKLMGFATV